MLWILTFLKFRLYIYTSMRLYVSNALFFWSGKCSKVNALVSYLVPFVRLFLYVKKNGINLWKGRGGPMESKGACQEIQIINFIANSPWRAFQIYFSHKLRACNKQILMVVLSRALKSLSIAIKVIRRPFALDKGFEKITVKFDIDFDNRFWWRHIGQHPSFEPCHGVIIRTKLIFFPIGWIVEPSDYW